MTTPTANFHNCYVTVDAFKEWLRLPVSGATLPDKASNSNLLFMIEDASRYVDALCGRYFYVRNATINHDTARTDGEVLVLKDDLQSTSAVTVDEGDTSWTEGTHYDLWPYDGTPKLQMIARARDGYSFEKGARNEVAITGEWGYGSDADSAWQDTEITGTISTATGTALTLNTAGTVEAGHTIKIEDEQMFVESVSDTTATVVRGVNGTTAAAHTAASVSLAAYPSRIVKACLSFATRTYRQAGDEEYFSVSRGDERHTRFQPETQRMRDLLLVGGYINQGGAF